MSNKAIIPFKKLFKYNFKKGSLQTNTTQTYRTFSPVLSVDEDESDGFVIRSVRIPLSIRPVYRLLAELCVKSDFADSVWVWTAGTLLPFTEWFSHSSLRNRAFFRAVSMPRHLWDRVNPTPRPVCLKLSLQGDGCPEQMYKADACSARLVVMPARCPSGPTDPYISDPVCKYGSVSRRRGK